MSNEPDHSKYIRKAIDLSRRAVLSGNHPFGAILVKDGEILLEAENAVDTEHDCTQHAELRLVSKATRSLDNETIPATILYTSTEPCPMCAGAIFWSGIKQVVYGCSDKSLAALTGHENFKITCKEILTEESGVKVIGPLHEDEALEVHKEFIKTHDYSERW
jgi:tRNA(Arg) A34 adenosine deaminase TadA